MDLVVVDSKCMVVAGIDSSDDCVKGLRHVHDRAVDILARGSDVGYQGIVVIGIS